jgi:N-acetylglucosaminyl-diphospho-decaprenol L-rhamnosyltransferase
MADVDVIVVSYNSRDQLRACVEPLTEMADTHVIVVDSASADRSLEVVEGLPVQAVQLEENRGFGYGCNEGFRRGTSPFVLLLNPDARLDRAGMDALIDALQADPRRAAVGPRIVDESGVRHDSIRRTPRAVSSFAQALFLHRLFPSADELIHDPDAYAHAHAVDWLSGACLMLRRDALEEVGGLDSGFFLYREDADLCRRLTEAGHGVWFEPRATCVHIGGASRPRESLYAVLAASRIRYARKHGGRRGEALERTAVVLRGLTHAALGAGGRPARAGHARAIRAGFSGRS